MKDGERVEHRITPTTGPRDGVVLGMTYRDQVRVLWWDGEETEEDPGDLVPATTFLEGMERDQDHLPGGPQW